MKLYIILYMLFVIANGEKKINLEDIERDNLKAESKSKSESINTDETKYSVKSETSQPNYQVSSGEYDTPNDQSTFVTPQPPQNEEYRQPNKYLTSEYNYQQQETLQPHEIQALQQYAEYQLKEAAGLKTTPSQIYAQQPDNSVQTAQIKTLANKLVKSPGKDTVYVDVPMGHFLSYYPHVSLNQGLNNVKYQPTYRELAQAQQISIPFYTPYLSQKQLFSPVRMAYQIVPQYTLNQPYSVPTTVFHKFTKGPIYATKKPVAPSTFVTPVYEQQDQSYAQGKQLLYTQAYIAQPQQHQQHVSPAIYNQANTFYAQGTPLQADLYARAPVYLQDNYLHGQVNQYSGQVGQSYVSPLTEQQQLPRQNLHQEERQSVSQNYVKVPDEPYTDFVPPQVPHQKFKPDVTQLVAVSSEHEETPRAKEHVASSEPRSLLDTYIPSNLIAAQDSARYRERPLQLESGFLPSKTNFVQYKKRKTTQQ